LEEKLYRSSLRAPHESQAVGFLSRTMKIKNRTGVRLRFSMVSVLYQTRTYFQKNDVARYA